MAAAFWSGMVVGMVAFCAACGGVAEQIAPQESGGAAGTASGGAGATPSEGGGGTTTAPDPAEPESWIAGCAQSAGAPFERRPLPSGSIDDLRGYLDAIRADIVGRWRGIVTTPWMEPYAVGVDFEATGHYSSRCLGDCVAFYYGTDEDSDLKQYRVDDLSIEGIASGEIDIAFDNDYSSPDPNYGLPVWQGLIEELEVSTDAKRMTFEFWRDDDYGPVSFDLWRCE